MLLFLLKMNIGHLSGDDGPTRLNGRRIFEDDIVLVWNALDCKRRMERKTALFSLDRKGYHVSWDAIPAWVCTQCGEPYFEAREVELIQGALSAMEREGGALVGAGSFPAKS